MTELEKLKPVKKYQSKSHERAHIKNGRSKSNDESTGLKPTKS